jgi:multidrug efflux pump
MRRFNLSAWAVHHQALILFFIIALSIGGALSYQQLGRGEDPSFTIKLVTISAIWPGATAEDMQTQVADPIEKKLQELPYFDKVITYSKGSFTAMQVVFRDDAPPAKVPDLFYQLRKKLTDIRGNLPPDLIGPNINDEYGDVDSILYMMTGTGADYAQLKVIAEGMRQHLLKVPGVTKVNLYGTQDEKIYVEFSQAKLATLGVTPQALFDSLIKQNAVVPAGVVDTSAQRVPLRVTGALDGAKAVAETPVQAEGRVFRLGDIATVTRGFVDPPTYHIRQEGKPALGIGVVMAQGANILHLGEAVKKATAEGHRDKSDRRSAECGESRDQRIRQGVCRGVGDRAAGEFSGAGLAHRACGGAVGASGAGCGVHHHESDGDRSAPRHTRCADHRAWAAGR